MGHRTGGAEPDPGRRRHTRIQTGKSTRRGWTTLLTCGLAILVVLSPVLSGGHGAGHIQVVLGVGRSAPHEISHPSNSTDCNLVNESYFNGTVSALGWPSEFGPDAYVMWSDLCGTPTFASLLQEWGGWTWEPPVTANGTTTPGYWTALNFSVQFGASRPPSAWGNWTYFGVSWISWAPLPSNASKDCAGPPCKWNEYWTGSLPGTNYSGPSLTFMGIVSVPGPPPPKGESHSGALNPSVYVEFGLPVAAVLAIGVGALVTHRRRKAKTRQDRAEAPTPRPPESLPTPPYPSRSSERESGTAGESLDPLDDAF